MTHLDSLPLDQQAAMRRLLARTKAQHEKLLAEAPEPIRRLGNVIRLSFKSGSTRSLERWLNKLGFKVGGDEKIDTLRDVLIINRGDLIDLAPAARARLRVRYLRQQPGSAMTGDYAHALYLGVQPRCSECQYLGTAPEDEGPDAKPCISLGARGGDLACFGFTRILEP